MISITIYVKSVTETNGAKWTAKFS